MSDLDTRLGGEIGNVDDSILVLFLFDENSYSIRLDMTCSLIGVKNSICEHWPHLTPCSIGISYSLENKVITVDTDSDLHTILCFQIYKKSSYFVFSVKSSVCALEFNLGNSLSITSDHQSSSVSSGCLNIKSCGESSSYLKDIMKKGSQLNLADFIGYCFNGAEDFREFLMAYQIKEGRELIFVKNCPERISIICSWFKEGCKFTMYASSDPGHLIRFFIRTYRFEHSCGAGLRDVKKVHITSRFVKSLIIDQIRDVPMKKPKDIINDFRREFNFTPSYYYAYTGKQLALKEIYGDDAMSYNDLNWYLEAIQKTNPGSYVALEVDSSTNQFERICIGFSACLLGFRHCRPMIFLDAAFLKGRQGVLLAATAKNGNQGFFPLAMGVVSHENESNWSWFLEHLKKMLNEDRELVFISDRQWGLLLGVPKVFPSSFHSYCTFHMEQNIGSVVKACKGDTSIVDLFKLLTRASNPYDFDRYMLKFKEIGGVAAINFLKDKPFEHWTDLFFQGKRYGEYSSNVAESFNSWIVDDRFMPITSCLDGIRVKIMEQMAKRREDCHRWTTALCPVMEQRLSQLVNEGFGWDTYRSSENVFEVRSPISHHVDLEKRLCTCNQWKVTGFPCAHAIKCMNKSRQSVYDYVDYYFTADAFRSSYAYAINPIPNVGKPIVSGDEVIIKPPKEFRGAGRPSTKRHGGFSYSQSKRNKCSNCNQGGHNKRNCQASMKI